MFKNLENHSRIISEKLLETSYLLEILQEFYEYDGKMGILITLAEKNIKTSFNEIEICRKIISQKGNKVGGGVVRKQ